MWVGRQEATFPQNQDGDWTMICNFLRDTAHDPAFHPSVAMATQHDQIEMMRVHHREKRCGWLAHDHYCFGVYAHEAAPFADVIQVVAGLFKGSLNVHFYRDGFECEIGHDLIGETYGPQ